MSRYPFCALVLLFVAYAAVQPERGGIARSSEAPEIRVDVGVVRVPVTVRGPLGNPVAGLQREHFRVYEDGVERTVRYFSSQDSPVSIGIVLDVSGSMDAKLAETRQAIAGLLRTAAEGDEYFLVTFADRPRLLSDIVGDPEKILQKLARVRAGGWTALLDGMNLGLAVMKRTANNRKALIILSDGADNRSRFTETEVRRQLREADSCVYALGMFDEAQSDRNLRLIADLAEDTGGMMLTVHTVADLPGAVEQLALNIRNLYVLGYAPALPYDGRYRRVTVELLAPDARYMTVSARSGYYSPSPAPKQ